MIQKRQATLSDRGQTAFVDAAMIIDVARVGSASQRNAGME
jgi:hypothetical protein